MRLWERPVACCSTAAAKICCEEMGLHFRMTCLITQCLIAIASLSDGSEFRNDTRRRRCGSGRSTTPRRGFVRPDKVRRLPRNECDGIAFVVSSRMANRHLTRLSATPSALGWDADQIAWCTDHEVEANMWDRRRFIASGLGAARYVRSSIAILHHVCCLLAAGGFDSFPGRCWRLSRAPFYEHLAAARS